MIHILDHVLSGDELARVRQWLPQVGLADGRMTNPESGVKRNLQAPQGDAANERIAQLVRDALARHPDARRWMLPKQMARTTVVRYEPGMTYGWHVDEALFPSTPPMRSDISCTVFLSDPVDYDGGELTMQLGAQELAYKLPAGSALVYPSTTIHQVAPVTRGVRVAAITWLQSWVADAARREVLVQVEDARALIARNDPADAARIDVLLAAVRTNLFRMWADT
ncbi:Fe2+-dependent dioxygenase [Lysobacter xanthus]